MNTFFLDTGYIIALEAADDQYHDMVLSHWRNLKRTFPTLVTATYVFDEIVTFFNSRNQHPKAVELGNRLISSSSVRLIQFEIQTDLTFDRHFVQAGFQKIPEKRNVQKI